MSTVWSLLLFFVCCASVHCKASTTLDELDRKLTRMETSLNIFMAESREKKSCGKNCDVSITLGEVDKKLSDLYDKMIAFTSEYSSDYTITSDESSEPPLDGTNGTSYIELSEDERVDSYIINYMAHLQNNFQAAFTYRLKIEMSQMQKYITDTCTQEKHEACPWEWQRDGHFCYYFGTENQKINYHSAKTYCQGINGTLLSIKTERENKFILSKIVERSWLGMDDFKKPGTYEWNDGTAIDFQNWGYRQPSSGTERCGEYLYFNDDFFWNDVSCFVKNSPICKRSTIYR